MSKMNLTPINKRKRVMGWVAVALSLAVASFFGMFAGAEGVTEGWPAVLGHSAQMLVVIVPALGSRWPARSRWTMGSGRATPCAKGLAGGRGRHGDCWAVPDLHGRCTRP